MPLLHRAARALLASSALAACSGASRDRGGAMSGAPAGADAGESVTRTASCPPAPAAARGSAEGVATKYDVIYAERDGDPLRFDLAWPRGGGLRPLVVLLHGGGWEGGSRASLHDEMLALAAQGYAAATVSYRLTSASRNVFPAAVADVRCAVRVLRSRAADYGIDPRRVAAAGFSAGAHLASMLGAAGGVAGLDAECAAARGAGDASVRAVVSYAGPQDLRVDGPYTQEQARLVTNFLGVFPGDDPARAALASPIVHAGAGDAAFLLVHGAADALVPVEHSRRMAAALRRAGTPASVLELPRTGHEFVGLATSGNATVRCTTMAFLANYLTP